MRISDWSRIGHKISITPLKGLNLRFEFFCFNFVTFVSVGFLANGNLLPLTFSLDANHRYNLSPIWDYYYYDNEQNRSSCKACGKMMKTSPRNGTTVVIYHLKHRHPDSYSAYILKKFGGRMMTWWPVNAFSLILLRNACDRFLYKTFMCETFTKVWKH